MREPLDIKAGRARLTACVSRNQPCECHRDLDHALELITTLTEQLQWCGGSADFSEGGIARVGWNAGPAQTLAQIKSLPTPESVDEKESVI